MFIHETDYCFPLKSKTNDSKLCLRRKVVQHVHLLEDGEPRGFHEFTGQEHFVEHSVHLVEEVNEVQLTDVAKVGVEKLDKDVNGFEHGELVVGRVAADDKVETNVTAVNKLVRAELRQRRGEAMRGLPEKIGKQKE